MEMILANVRTPEERLGDLTAQLAALKTGEKRIEELIGRYGPGMVTLYARGLQSYSEKVMRGLIEEMRFSNIARYTGITYTVTTEPFASDSNTRGLWHFDETAGSTVFTDTSSAGNNLTGHNGAQTHNP